jgi:hypothetical protein
MEPINYMLDVKNPIEEAMRGYGIGRADIEQRQVMDMRAAAEARAASEFEMRRAEAERQRAQAEAMQAQLAGLRDMAISGTLTTDALNQFALNNASTFGEFQSAFEAMEAPRREADTQFGIQLSTSLLSGKPEVALAMLDERIAAAENAGDAQEAAALRANRKLVEIDPQGQGVATLALLTASGALPKETMKSILDATGQSGEATGTFRTLQERARAAGLTEGTPEYRDFMLRGGGEKGPLVQNIVGAGETEFAKKAGAEAATQFSTVANQGTAASRSLVELENLEANLANVETGGGAAFKAFLGGYGINTEDLGEIQAAQAAINRLVPQQRPPGSGTMSDADLLLFKASLPALINQPGGNKIIIDTIRAINEYDVAASIIAGQALDGEITQAEARKALRELPNPLADFKAPKTAPKPGAQPVVIDGVTIQRIE